MKEIKALTQSFSRNELSDILDRVEMNFSSVDSIVNDVVAKYCKPLDDYVKQVDDILKEGKDIADAELDDFALNIPSLIYFACEAQESIGIKEDVARAVRAEIFNTARDSAEGTVSDKDSIGDLAAQRETIVVIIYQRAYKKIKARIEAAYELLNSVKKVISHRQTQFDVSRADRY